MKIVSIDGFKAKVAPALLQRVVDIGGAQTMTAADDVIIRSKPGVKDSIDDVAAGIFRHLAIEGQVAAFGADENFFAL